MGAHIVFNLVIFKNEQTPSSDSFCPFHINTVYVNSLKIIVRVSTYSG